MDHRESQAAERDEYRIAGRVWLVKGRIEMMQAEREVDRIDILERRREEGQVRDQPGRCKAVQLEPADVWP